MDDHQSRQAFKAERVNAENEDKTFVNRQMFKFDHLLPENISVKESVQMEIQPQGWSGSGQPLIKDNVFKFIIRPSDMFTNFSLSYIQSIIKLSTTTYCTVLNQQNAFTNSPACSFASNIGDCLFSNIQFRVNGVDISDQNNKYYYLAAHLRKLLRFNKSWTEAPYVRRQCVGTGAYTGTVTTAALTSAQSVVAYRKQSCPADVYGINLHDGYIGTFEVAAGAGYGVCEDSAFSAIDEVAAAKAARCNFLTDGMQFWDGTHYNKATTSGSINSQGNQPKYQAVVTPLMTAAGESAICFPPNVQIEIFVTINNPQVFTQYAPAGVIANTPQPSAAGPVIPQVICQSMYLYVEQFLPTVECMNLYREAILSQNVIIPFLRSKVDSFQIPSGQTTLSISNVFTGEKPQAVFFILPRAQSITGNSNMSPFAWGVHSAIGYDSTGAPIFFESTMPQVLQLQTRWNSDTYPKIRIEGTLNSQYLNGATYTFPNNSPTTSPYYNNTSATLVQGVYTRMYQEYRQLCHDPDQPALSYDQFCTSYTIYPINYMAGDTKLGMCDDGTGTLGSLQFDLTITSTANSGAATQSTQVFLVAFGVANVVLSHVGSGQMVAKLEGF